MVLEDEEEREDEELDVLKTVLGLEEELEEELEDKLEDELEEELEDELDERSASSYTFLNNTSPFDIVTHAPTIRFPMPFANILVGISYRSTIRFFSSMLKSSEANIVIPFEIQNIFGCLLTLT